MLVHLKNTLRKLSDNFYRFCALIWTIMILYLSLISANQATKFNVFDFYGVDKLGHIIFYTTFSFLWCMSFRERNTDKKNILIFSISFGVLMEICQLYLFNGRSFELYDILANILGSVVGIILFKKFIN